jgi:hypothetical protein
MPYTDEQIFATAKSYNLPYQTEEDAETSYCELLDELHEINPGSLFENYSGSTMLELIDPIAYRCGFADYIGTNDEYYYELFVDENVFYMSEETYNECIDILNSETEED